MEFQPACLVALNREEEEEEEKHFISQIVQSFVESRKVCAAVIEQTIKLLSEVCLFVCLFVLYNLY